MSDINVLYKTYKTKDGEDKNYKISFPSHINMSSIFSFFSYLNYWNKAEPTEEIFVNLYYSFNLFVFYNDNNAKCNIKHYYNLPDDLQEYLKKYNIQLDIITENNNFYYFLIDNEEELFYLLLKYPNYFLKDESYKIKVEEM